jgi:hypothetical protein
MRTLAPQQYGGWRLLRQPAFDPLLGQSRAMDTNARLSTSSDITVMTSNWDKLESLSHEAATVNRAVVLTLNMDSTVFRINNRFALTVENPSDVNDNYHVNADGIAAMPNVRPMARKEQLQ